MEQSEITLVALLTAAVLTGFLHTIAGPDHYLPFIAIAQSRKYGFLKTMLWTLVCGIGHVGSSLLLAGVFLLFAELLSEAKLEFVEEWRGDLAAYAMIGMGAAILLHALYRRFRKHRHEHRHVGLDGKVYTHTHARDEIHAEGGEKLSYWVVFIIFVLGPCEAMLPLLTASAVLGTFSVLVVSLVFSVVTIGTMMGMVALGLAGVRAVKMPYLERFAPEIAGVTVMACGLAIVCLGL